MKTINVRDLQKEIRQCVDLAQREHVVVTRHGRPAAIVIGVEGKDWEDVSFQTNASFWKMIQGRRTEPTISLAEMRARLGVRAPAGSRPNGNTPRGHRWRGGRLGGRSARRNRQH